MYLFAFCFCIFGLELMPLSPLIDCKTVYLSEHSCGQKSNIFKVWQQPIYLKSNILCRSTLLCTASLIYGLKSGICDTFGHFRQQMDLLFPRCRMDFIFHICWCYALLWLPWQSVMQRTSASHESDLLCGDWWETSSSQTEANTPQLPFKTQSILYWTQKLECHINTVQKMKRPFINALKTDRYEAPSFNWNENVE